ncbi:GYDIA family GHMP kinase [Snuella sedimenti]|uniref:GHMP kinase n=1 Tax=Snuella sedimenti TaxID=2798802 RepID=A0A8J7LLM6_9FLAO|nr:GYDIA family GHMP kinase [Snuella sedimenti]MBJ6366489.1 GHMP kinase [Snuella sedimenti]
MSNYYSNGKLLLTGEYVVLDGALSLAIPTKFGQWLDITPINEPKLIWKSIDADGTVWFEDTFTYKPLSSFLQHNDTSNTLIQILNTVKTLNPDFLKHDSGYVVTTKLNFPRNWGLGTSSTLINNMAQWAKIDAYKLLESTFGGSGYDIACAQNNTPITYQLTNKVPLINTVNFNTPFKNDLYFVYLNKKQNSRDGIRHYNANKGNARTAISEINAITTQLISCRSLEEFENLITAHETIISKLIKIPPIKERFFKDFKGSVKSLGAWGGDFILVTSNTPPHDYFKNKGFETLLPYNDMVLDLTP